MLASHRRAFGSVVVLALATATGFGLACVTVPTAFRQNNPNTPGSFGTAKTKALKLYQDAGHRTTFYCGCDFKDDKSLSPAGCGYEPRVPITRRSRSVRTRCHPP